MNNIKIIGLSSEIIKTVELLSKEYDFILSDEGKEIHFEKNSENKLHINIDNEKASVSYSTTVQIFRGLGHVLQNIDSTKFNIEEEAYFKTNGNMIDCSRNMVLSLETIKKIIRIMSVMGQNMLMLYTEDTYEIKEQPYFGYLRGRYSKKELKEIDDYAFQFGIELIPCIQALGHLEQFLKWPSSTQYRDTSAVLLAKDEGVYELINQMITSITSCVRSNRINICMDEAFDLGKGKFFDNHGAVSGFEIMSYHLKRIMDIINENNLEAMMWSDMYFRTGSKTHDYYDFDAKFPDDIKEQIPSNMDLIYWDYYHEDKDFYRKFIDMHRKLSDKIVFAGGTWIWGTFTARFPFTLNCSNAGLYVCREEGIKDVINTIWMDDGAESNIFISMIGWQLYAEHGYVKDFDYSKPEDKEYLKKRMEFCTKANFDTIHSLGELNDVPNKNGSIMSRGVAKGLLWQDPLLGVLDKYSTELYAKKHFTNLNRKYTKLQKKNNKWNDLLYVPTELTNVLTMKSHLGPRLKKYYDSNNRKELFKIYKYELKSLNKSIGRLRKTHRKMWFKYAKPFGWEILDQRYGGLIARVNTTRFRLGCYLNGKIKSIPELEEERLFFNGKNDNGIQLTYWALSSPSCRKNT